MGIFGKTNVFVRQRRFGGDEFGAKQGGSAGLPYWNALEPGLTQDGANNLVQSSGSNHFAWSNRRIQNVGNYFEITVDANFLGGTEQFFIQTTNSGLTSTYGTFIAGNYYISGGVNSYSAIAGDTLRFEVTSATTVAMKKNGAVLGTITHAQTNFLVGIYSGSIGVGQTILKPVFSGTVGV